MITVHFTNEEFDVLKEMLEQGKKEYLSTCSDYNRDIFCHLLNIRLNVKKEDFKPVSEDDFKRLTSYLLSGNNETDLTNLILPEVSNEVLNEWLQEAKQSEEECECDYLSIFNDKVNSHRSLEPIWG